jgi:hypothetical protein
MDSSSSVWSRGQQRASSDLVTPLGALVEAPCLVFVFPGENLSPADRRGGDGGFNVIYFLEATPWKPSDRLKIT